MDFIDCGTGKAECYSIKIMHVPDYGITNNQLRSCTLSSVRRRLSKLSKSGTAAARGLPPGERGSFVHGVKAVAQYHHSLETMGWGWSAAGPEVDGNDREASHQFYPWQKSISQTDREWS